MYHLLSKNSNIFFSYECHNEVFQVNDCSLHIGFYEENLSVSYCVSFHSNETDLQNAFFVHQECNIPPTWWSPLI